MYKFIEDDIAKQKKEWDEWLAKKEAELPIAEGVTIVEDIPYINDGKECHKMDIYYPTKIDEDAEEDSREKLPVIFDFHGGGLLLCSRKFNKWFCAEMAKRGCLVFCIDYPLVPDSDIYGILRDSYEGVRKAVKLIDEYSGDENQITMCGDSAGGFIATYLSVIQNDSNLADLMEIKRIPFQIKKLAAISAMFYSSKIDKQGIFILRPYFYGKNCKKHPFWQYVNPENTEIIASLPPMICTTSKGDFLRSYTTKYVKVLEKHGKAVQVFDYADKKLKHDYVCLQPEEPASQEIMDLIARWT